MAYIKLRPRRGTGAKWVEVNPLLAEGEIGFEVPEDGVGTGSVKMKMGDGSTRWNDLPYALSFEGGDVSLHNPVITGYMSMNRKADTAVMAYSVTLGYNCTASFNYAISEGFECKSTGLASHSEGEQTESNGRGSHSEGSGTKAIGNYSHAEGLETIARGNASHASGYGTIVAYDNQNAIGAYNDNQSNSLFEIGNGNESNRSNAFRVTNTGDTYTAKGYYGDNIVFNNKEISMSRSANSNNVGKYSTSLGLNNRANYDYQTSLGIRNKNFPDSLLEIGNGTINSKTSIKSSFPEFDSIKTNLKLSEIPYKSSFVAFEKGFVIVGQGKSYFLPKEYLYNNNNSNNGWTPILNMTALPPDNIASYRDRKYFLKLSGNILFCIASESYEGEQVYTLDITGDITEWTSYGTVPENFEVVDDVLEYKNTEGTFIIVGKSETSDNIYKWDNGTWTKLNSFSKEVTLIAGDENILFALPYNPIASDQTLHTYYSIDEGLNWIEKTVQYVFNPSTCIEDMTLLDNGVLIIGGGFDEILITCKYTKTSSDITLSNWCYLDFQGGFHATIMDIIDIDSKYVLLKCVSYPYDIGADSDVIYYNCKKDSLFIESDYETNIMHFEDWELMYDLINIDLSINIYNKIPYGMMCKDLIDIGFEPNDFYIFSDSFYSNAFRVTSGGNTYTAKGYYGDKIVFNNKELSMNRNSGAGYYSVSLGYNNKATGDYSYAEGYGTTASSDESHAEGFSTTASGDVSHAEGIGTTASGDVSHAEGYYTTASRSYSHVGGFYTITGYDYQTAIGRYNDNQSDSLFEIGNGKSSSNRSNVFRVTSTGDTYTALGYYGDKIVFNNKEISMNRKASTTIGQYSVALGYNNTASGLTSHAGGADTIASGSRSHSEGESTVASGQAAHAEGSITTASGNVSHAEGIGTNADGQAAHAEGESTVASGDSSHAEGYNTNADGQAAHAEGESTVAYGQAAHAEGESTVASGDSSHAEGYNTNADGQDAHSEGYSTTAIGNYSHAAGYHTTAGYTYQTVIGHYNDNNIHNLFEIGNGSGESNRSNAFCVTASGDVRYSGSIHSTSDINKKDNIVPLYDDNKYDKLFDSLEPVSYIFKNKEKDKIHTGMIAQQVEESLEKVGLDSTNFAGFTKEVSKTKQIINEDGKDKEIEIETTDYYLSYTEFIALNIMKTQKHTKEINELKETIELLKQEIELLKNK